MEKSIIQYYSCLAVLIFLFAGGCKKQDAFLNAKPNQNLAVPSTLGDYELLLENESLFNRGPDPGLGEISTDDYYVTDNVYNNRLATVIERNAYIWAKDIYQGFSYVSDWNAPYKQVYVANTVLDGLSSVKYSPDQQDLYNQIRGEALYFRSYAFYNLVKTFSVPYDSATAGTDLGIPLRLHADINVKSFRATEQQCYDQVISDIKTADHLLPLSAQSPTKPSAVAARGLLARIYLSIGNYDSAYKYADDCLASYSTLVDYNTLNPGRFTISTSFLKEDLYHAAMSYGILAAHRYSITDSVLYNSYDSNDLRKTVFFIISGGLPYFRGNYDYRYYTYDGIATDEIYLIRSECNARMGNTAAAMNDLNTLLVTRWLTGTFVPYTTTDPMDALKQILAERRKELVFRGARWTDLRRLNKDPQFAVTLSRIINGTIYTLPPKDPRYAMPIPDAEIQLSGIPQNPR
jgi:hypothetical protein